MKTIVWAITLAVAALTGVSASHAQAQPAAAAGIDPQEAISLSVACYLSALPAEQKRTACLAAWKANEGSDTERQRIAAELCLASGPIRDRDICYDTALELLAHSAIIRDRDGQRLIDEALPSLCAAGDGASCVLYARSAVNGRGQSKTPLSAAESEAMIEQACRDKAPNACFFAAKAAAARKDWPSARDFMQQACALGDKAMCDGVKPQADGSPADPARAYGLARTDEELIEERCAAEKHRASCYYVATRQAYRKESEIGATRAACLAGDSHFCAELARQEAFAGDPAKVDGALVKACELHHLRCTDLADFRSGKKVYERSPDFLAPDPQYIAAELAKIRAGRNAESEARYLREVMLCDVGNLSACQKLGMKMPRGTADYTPLSNDEFVTTILASADDKCRVKREADFCRELAIVLRPRFFAQEARDMPRAARFGAAACMLDKFDMCAFSGVALVEGQHGGPPDRKNGGAMLNKGCSGRDAASCYFFAMVLAQDGRIDQAKLAAQTALAVNPSFAEAKELLAKLNQEP